MASNAQRLTTLAAAVLLLAAGAAIGWWAGRSPAPSAVAQGATVAAPAAGASAAAGAERKVLYWYDPMVPTQKFDKPGKSPFMDMQLVPRYADEGDAQGGVAVSAAAQQSLGLRTAVAETRALQPRVDVVGTVGLNERDVTIVQARAAGFVERVMPHAPGDVLAAGAPLAEILHPDWLAAQQEYLALKATGDAALAQAARQRLVLLGMPAALVERVVASGQPQAVTTVTAGAGGLLAELMVRPGMTVAPGMTLARLNGLGTAWVEAAVPESLAAALAPGQGAEVRQPGWPDQVLRGRVAAVLPEARADSRTLRVRIELPNPGHKLRAGQSVQVALLAGARAPAVVVPAEALIRTGRRALLYVLDDGADGTKGRYRPLEVQPGQEVDGFVEIVRGLQAGQRVVTSGPFLIDSEASLQGVPAAPVDPEYEASGTVSEVEAGSITLDHTPVPALKWPAMTMPFQLAKPDLARGLKAGDRVRFAFRQQRDGKIVEWQVTRLTRDAAPAAPAAPTPSAPASAAHVHGARP